MNPNQQHLDADGHLQSRARSSAFFSDVWQILPKKNYLWQRNSRQNLFD